MSQARDIAQSFIASFNGVLPPNITIRDVLLQQDYNTSLIDEILAELDNLRADSQSNTAVAETSITRITEQTQSDTQVMDAQTDTDTSKRIELPDIDNLPDFINRLDIRVAASRYMQPDRHGGFICDKCGSGSGRKGTGLHFYIDETGRPRLKCFVCKVNFTVLSLICHFEHLDNHGKDFIKAMKIACDIFGISDADSVPAVSNSQPIKNLSDMENFHYSRLDEARAGLQPFFNTQGGIYRAIPYADYSRIQAGYLPDLYFNADNKIHPALIFRNDISGIFGRAVDGANVKENIHKTSTFTVNVPVTDIANLNVFIVESVIDALSIAYATDWQAYVIASGGTSGLSQLKLTLKKLFPAEKPNFILMLDNDENSQGKNSGQDAAVDFLKELRKEGYCVVNRVLSDEKNLDANSYLIRYGKQALKNLVEKILSNAQIELANLMKEISGRNALKTALKQTDSQSTILSADDISRAVEMLKFIDCAACTYDDWLKIGMALKTNGNPIDDWLDWSKTDSARYDEKTCRYKWDSFNRNEITLATIAHFAIQGGYKPARNDKAQVDELADAVNFLQNLTADNLTREIVRDSKTLRQVALCYEYGNPDVADDFVDRVVDMNFPNISRRSFMRDIDKMHKALKDEMLKVKSARKNQIKAENIRQLEKLKAMPANAERNEKMIKLIRDTCDWAIDTKTGEKLFIKGSSRNINLIFTYDPTLDGLFGFDEFKAMDVFLKNPAWKKNVIHDAIGDRDVAHIRIYLRDTYADCDNPKMIDDYLIKFSDLRAFHDVKQYLESLPNWDGKPRAETLFIDFLGVEDSAYSRKITLNWLLGAVARIYHSGCDFRWCLILHGKQKIGKSTIAAKLGGKWTIKLTESLDDSHAVDVLQSTWLCEIEEFSAARKAEINAIKSFISRPADTRRGAYARREKTVPRHCLFIVTCNDSQFLRDQTGNSRFKILQCKSTSPNLALKNLTDEFISQVWAEVMHKFNEMFENGFDALKLDLPADIDEQAENIADHFTYDDGLTNEIQSFLDIPIPHKVIWLLLTKDERRKFFEQGSIFLYKEDLDRRFNTYADCNILADDELSQTDFDTAKEESKIESENDTAGFRFYGKELRQHICPSEVFCECFGQDRRKSMARITEVLDKLDDWQKGTRYQRHDPQYNDQRKPYFRVVIDADVADADLFKGCFVPESKIPF